MCITGERVSALAGIWEVVRTVTGKDATEMLPDGMPEREWNAGMVVEPLGSWVPRTLCTPMVVLSKSVGRGSTHGPGEYEVLARARLRQGVRADLAVGEALEALSQFGLGQSATRVGGDR